MSGPHRTPPDELATLASMLELTLADAAESAHEMRQFRLDVERLEEELRQQHVGRLPDRRVQSRHPTSL